MAIRIAKFEVYRFADTPEEAKVVRKRWHDASRAVQVVVNCCWQVWETWHVQHGTAAKLREYLSILADWHKADAATRGPKPKSDGIDCMPKSLTKLIREAAFELTRDMNARPRELAINETCGLIRSRKSAAGSLPAWQSILLCREGRPSTTKAAPIPFDKRNSTLMPPIEDGARFRLRLRTDRFEDGKSSQGKSHEDTVELLTNRRGIKAHEARLWRVIHGKDKLKGSSLYFDEQRGKWFALLAIEASIEAKVAGEGTAILSPGRDVPFRLFVGNRVIPIGYADHVEEIRSKIIGERRSRQEQYRRGQRSSKGHGRGRAIQSWNQRLSRRWKNFQTTYNHDVSRRALELCQQNGVGRLIYLQPAGPKSATRCLSKAGAIREAESWSWFQVGTFLNYKSEGSGIHVEIKKCDASGKRKAAAHPPVPPVQNPGKGGRKGVPRKAS